MLKTTCRQYQQCTKVQTMLKNNLISLLDTAFLDANRLFTSPTRADGSEKWVDFISAFWHCECVCELSEKAFTAKYQKWCKRHGYTKKKVNMVWTHFPFYDFYSLPLTQCSYYFPYCCSFLVIKYSSSVFWSKCYTVLNHTLHDTEKSYETGSFLLINPRN